MQTFYLTALGWTPELSGAFASLAAQGLIPGRVGARHRGHIALYTASGEIAATPSGRLRHAAEATALPVVGSWPGESYSKGGSCCLRPSLTRMCSDRLPRNGATRPHDKRAKAIRQWSRERARLCFRKKSKPTHDRRLTCKPRLAYC